MNTQIKNALQFSVSGSRLFMEHNSIRNSVEDYRTQWMRETEALRRKNNPEDEWIIQNNLETIESLHELFKVSLQNEKAHNGVVQKIMQKFNALTEEDIVQDFIQQLKYELPKLTLKKDYDEMYCFIFEVDDSPTMSLTCYPTQNVDINIYRPKTVDLDISDYASSVIIQIECASILLPLFSQEYEDVIWQYENELEYFFRLKQMHLEFTFLCLHRALNSIEIRSILDQLPIHQNAVFFGGEHDENGRAIFVRGATQESRLAGFIDAVRSACDESSTNQEKAFLLCNDYYMNRLLGIMLKKPKLWVFVNEDEIDKSARRQIVRDDLDELTTKDIVEFLDRPMCVIAKDYEDKPENKRKFSPAITVQATEFELMPVHKIFTFEDALYASQMLTASILKDFRVTSDYKTFILDGILAYRYECTYTFEHADMAAPVPIELSVIKFMHKNLAFDINMHQSVSVDEDLTEQFDLFVKSIRLG